MTARALPRRRIGRTAISVTELGFGAAALGNLYQPLSDNSAHETLAHALDRGIGYVDTAPYYGLGLSERRVGDVLRGRDDVILSTKVGRLLVPDRQVRDDRERYGFRSAMPFEPVYDYSYDGVMRSFDASLDRLGLASIDILFVHDIGQRTHGDQDAGYFDQLTSGGGLQALVRLRDAGAIAAFGIGVNEVEACQRVMDEADLDILLLAGRYTLLEQAPASALLARCSTAQTSVIVGGPYNSGILATGVRKGGSGHFDYAVAPPDIVVRVAAIEDLCERHGVELPAAALQFPLAHPAVACVIPGLDSADRVSAALELHSRPIPADFWRDLKAAGLIAPEAPTPGDTA